MTELAGVPSILPLLRRLSGPLECGDTDTVPVPSVLQIVTVAFIFSRSPFAHAMLLSHIVSVRDQSVVAQAVSKWRIALHNMKCRCSTGDSEASSNARAVS